MTAAKKREGNLTKEYTFTYDANGNLLRECFKNKPEVTYQYDIENRLKAVSDPQKLLMASTYDGDGNRAFQLNYNPDAECGYGKNVSGEIFMLEHSHNEDGSLTAEGELFGYICSATGRAYDLTEYVNDTNREHTEVLTAFNINTGFDTESYTYAGSSRLLRNNIWNEARDVNHDEMSYYLYDGQGSVTANTWYNGMVTDVYQYDPYGRMELGGEGHTDFYGYRAESYNPNTGLEYLRARYYNADKGRFFQEDTYLGDITDPLTLNRYAYVKNSPLNYADPGGHVAEYLTGPQYNPDDGWQANHYPLSQTGPEKTEFPIEIVSGTEAVKQFWGSVSEGLDHVMSQLKEAADLSLSQLRELRGWMKEAVSSATVDLCSKTVELSAEIAGIIFSLILGSMAGVGNAGGVSTDRIDELVSSNWNTTAYNIGKIIGHTAVLTAAMLALFFGFSSGMGPAMAGGMSAAGVSLSISAEQAAVGALGYTILVNTAISGNGLSMSKPEGNGGESESEIPDYKKDNRVPLDKETVLRGKDYKKTGKKIKGAQVYKKGDQYYYRDTFHTGEAAHLEVFDKRGHHLGEADPLTVIIKPNTADPTKSINIK